jgi:hypothetical protein
MTPTKPFAPSSWRLDKMVEAAMSACDADVEQAQFREAARIEARAARYMEAQARAEAQRRTVDFWQGR